MEDNYLVVSDRPWGCRAFREKISKLPGYWALEDLDEPEVTIHNLVVSGHKPRYVFFLFYSKRVPNDILKAYECIGFHMANLPFGRGGSPLQNQIERGIRETQITAFRMIEELDAGPIYMKQPLSLDGLAEEIYLRAADICAEMIETIIIEHQMDHPMVPTPQEFELEMDLNKVWLSPFKRRTPENSVIPGCKTLYALFDHLRMLDAEGYPRAFLVWGGYRFEFTRPALRDGRIEADVRITKEG